MSAYEAIEGAYNYHSNPLAPPGCKLIAHETPAQRKTWAAHGVDGFYLGPAMEHYRCHRIYIPSTHSERVVETVDFQPTMCEKPIVSDVENAIIAATNLTKALQQPGTINNLDLQTMEALQNLAALFHCKIRQKITGKATSTPRVVLPTSVNKIPPQRVHIIPPASDEASPPPRVNQEKAPTSEAPSPNNHIHLIPDEVDAESSINNNEPTPTSTTHRYPTRF